MTERHEIWKLADRLQMDIANADRRLVELRSHLAQLKLPDHEQKPQPAACPDCGVSSHHGHAADCPTLEPAEAAAE